MKTTLGCLASLAYFSFLAMLILGNMLGDCFPDMGHHCPTDHERNINILTILFGGIALYGLISFALVWIGKRMGKDEE